MYCVSGRWNGQLFIVHWTDNHHLQISATQEDFDENPDNIGRMATD
ncbi:MAG: hypothetical protein R3E08_09790 [Thiotrichaceae bacterium]